MDTLRIWLGAVFTIAVFSFLYGDNPAYRFSEHLFLGLAAAHLTVQGYQSIVSRAWLPFVQKGEWPWLIAIIGGLLLWCRWFKPVAWVSRLPLGFMMGIAAALSVRRAIDAEFYRQLLGTVDIKWSTPNNILYIVIVFCTIAYFLYVFNERTVTGAVVKKVGIVGQYAMMIAFGASLGAQIMGRLSLVIERLEFLVKTWLHLA